PRTRPPGLTRTATVSAMARIIVDAMNVIGSRPAGWWRDRDGAALRLIKRLQRLAAATGDEVAAVLDGRPSPELPEGVHGDGDREVVVLYATRPGRDAADDRIVEVVERDDEPQTLIVITSDRDLADRVRALSADVAGAGTLQRRLDEVDEA
ncbi:MAG: NYN domain-containing protein, partial [Dehalococcoidia bacterium]|nr:NYN domain-containing protein [Dehalococcoidia bacterium]